MKVKMFPSQRFVTSPPRRFVPVAVSLFSLATAAAVCASPAHAQKGGLSQMTVTIDGLRQGLFGGPNTQIPILKYDFNVISPFDPSAGGDGQATGKRQYAPIVFQKQWDISTIQINKALVTNERLRNVTFTFWGFNKKGVLDVNYKVILSNAVFVSLHQHVGDTQHDDTLNPQRLEEIGVVFEAITIQDDTSSSSDSFNSKAFFKPATGIAKPPVAVASAVTKPRSGGATLPKVTPRRSRRVAVSAPPLAAVRPR